MLVHELIEMLQNQDPNARVCIQEPTRCYWNRTAAKDVVAADSLSVKHSDYYNALIVEETVEENYDEETGEPLVDEDATNVVIICSTHFYQ